jgi:hypothetical protein
MHRQRSYACRSSNWALVRLPSSVPDQLGLSVESGSGFLATLHSPNGSPLGEHRFGKKSNSPNDGGRVYCRNPREHLLVVSIATPMDIRHSPFPRLCQSDDLLAPVFRIFVSSHQPQLHQTVDCSAERALVEFQPIGERLEVYAPEAIQLEQDVTLRDRDTTAIRLIFQTPANLAFENPKLGSKGAHDLDIHPLARRISMSCHKQLLYTPT